MHLVDSRIIAVAATIAIEIALVLGIAVWCYALTRAVAGRWPRAPNGPMSDSVRVTARRVLATAALIAIAGILAFNSWLIATGIDVPAYTRGRFGALAADSWLFLALTLLKLAAAWLGLMVVARLLRRGLEKLEAAINRWDGIVDNDRSLEEVDGITHFGLSTMTVRTSTRVRPGRQEAMAAALRLSIKEAFDRQTSSVERTGLVPAELFARRAR